MAFNVQESLESSEFLSQLYGEDSSILLFDGATGTSLQQANLTAEDFGGLKLEGCNENLVRTRPDVVREVHKSFLEAGCDVIETNTFGATSIVLGEYGLEQYSREINYKAAEIAKQIAIEFSTKEQRRYVAGSIGPTTKLPTLGHIEFDILKDAYKEQVIGLIDGGVDLITLETCQDVLQIKSALQGIEEGFIGSNKRVPIMVSVTMETTGTMLVGTDISTVVTILEPFPIDILGINCATGPQEMRSHIKYLSDNSPFAISCIPNAGLPENVGGVAHYKLTPIELKMEIMHFVEDLGVQIIGGCCGTTPDHIKSLSEIKNCLKPSKRIIRNSKNKQPRSKLNYEPSASSIYSLVPYKQDNSFLIVGERLNASGSKKARELLMEENWDGLISLAKDQLRENSHILDINVDYVGRDGNRDMKELVRQLVTNVNLPLMLDSTDWQKMESGLKVSGGKSILNSTNFEDGEERFFKVLQIAKQYGAAVVIGTIDEDGMARTAEKKLQIAERAYKNALDFGFPPYELFYDPLALPISTGLEEDRRNGLETIKAIKLIRENLNDVHIILGVSNISFGLSPAARISLNSVFLHDCCEAGLDAAIVSPSKILPLVKISDNHKNVCRDLIFDNRRFDNNNCTYDPLTELTSIFIGVTAKEARSSIDLADLPVEKRLEKHIIDGERINLEKSLEEALNDYTPLDIINKFLLAGMKVVGELFGSGQMQLPFVLQSAQTMKSAVSFLEPYLESSDQDNASKGKFLIATVKGDVHDIGKNLVDIILSNNGYEVINLGIKQDVENIINAQKEINADCIAMSGLLVKSTAFMKENLELFNKARISVPVILGGAALTPKFVTNDCAKVYNGVVVYGKDAFADLRFMDAYMEAKKTEEWNDNRGFSFPCPDGLVLGNKSLSSINISSELDKSTNKDQILTREFQNNREAISTNRSTSIIEEASITPPFIGSKCLYSKDIPIEEIIYYLDKNALFSGQWQMRKNKGQSKEQYLEFLEKEAQPILEKIIDQSVNESLLSPSVVYGYFNCGRKENSLIIFAEDCLHELGEFEFPRQKSGRNLCIADFYRDLLDNSPKDVLPMQAVTVGEEATKFAQKLYDNNEYTDYLYFHGFAVQMTEALAEWIHARIRKECGFSHLEPKNSRDILASKYRGSRYSFGYPACPNVSDSKYQLEWLDADRVGINMDSADQLIPEQSTTAIVALHSKACYFSA